MASPFFSVVVPVYNVEKFLGICIESVLQQTFQDFELILVDDGSTDSSGQICDTYCKKCPSKIRVLHYANQGQVITRETGLKFATGNYILILDSDDLLMKDALSKVYNVIQATNSDVVFYRWKLVDEIGKIMGKPSPELFSVAGVVDKKTVFEKLMSTTLLNPLWAKCCKREVFDTGVDFSEYCAVPKGADLLRTIPTLYQANSFYYLDEILYQYRINTASITHSYRKGQHQTLNVIRPMLYDYCVKLGLDTPENNTAFFRRYLLTLWVHLRALYGGISSETERYAVLDEMHSYEFVNRAQDYLDKAHLPLFERLGLSLFYERDNHKLDRYMRIFLGMQKVGHRLNQFKTGNDNEMR